MRRISSRLTTVALVGLLLGGSACVYTAPAAAQTRYGSILGGSGSDLVFDIAVNGRGDVFIVGETSSRDLPTGPDRPQTHLGDDVSTRDPSDAFVARLDHDATSIVWMTYLGGAGDDTGLAVAPRPDGGVCVTGSTESRDFPLLNPAQDRLNRGVDTEDPESDAFVTCYDQKGELVFSTYFGGSGQDSGSAIQVAPGGGIVVAGWTTSGDGPWSPGEPIPLAGAGARTRLRGSSDLFLASFSDAGDIRFAGYLGGNRTESVADMALGRSGTVYLTGSTSSTDFATDGSRLQAGRDAFIALLHPATGSRVVHLFGGQDGRIEGGTGIATSDGLVWVVGTTASKDLAGQPGVIWEGTRLPLYNNDAFVWLGTEELAPLSPVHAFVFGGPGHDRAWDVALDGAGQEAYVLGFSDSPSVLNVTPCSRRLMLLDIRLHDANPELTCLPPPPPPTRIEAHGIARAPDGRIYIAGGFGSEVPADFTPRPMPRPTPLSATWDAYVAVCCDRPAPAWPVGDLWVRHAGRPEQAVGRGRTGPLSLQAPTLRVANRARLVVTLGNDGDASSRFTLMTHESGTGLTTRYRSDDPAMGEAIRSRRGWVTPRLAPGDSVTVQIEVRYAPGGRVPNPALLPAITLTVVPGFGDYRPLDQIRILPGEWP